jgi:hypothetical protein
LRQILIDWLQENLSDPTTRLAAPDPEECCNVCNPCIFRTVSFPWDIVPSLRKPQTGTASGAFYDGLVHWGDNIVSLEHHLVKPEVSVRLLTQKSEWISLSTEYANIHSVAELEMFVKSTWLRDHCDELFEEFNDIKSYIVRNWPGASRLGTTAVAQVSVSQEQRTSLGGQTSVEVKYPTLQEKSISFLQERDEYISSLHRVIARVRENSALCSLNRTSLTTEPGIASEQLPQQRVYHGRNYRRQKILIEKRASYAL